MNLRLVLRLDLRLVLRLDLRLVLRLVLGDPQTGPGRPSDWSSDRPQESHTLDIPVLRGFSFHQIIRD